MATQLAALPVLEDQAHLARLFVEHHRRVLRAAYRITGNMADAEDVAQSVFLRLASGGEQAVANATSYLYRSAINGALDLLRRRKAAAIEPFDAPASSAASSSVRLIDTAGEFAAASANSSPEASLANRELGEALRVAISELPHRASEMFALRYLEDLGNREIADLMGTSQAVVAVTLFNTRAKLKKRLNELNWGKP